MVYNPFFDKFLNSILYKIISKYDIMWVLDEKPSDFYWGYIQEYDFEGLGKENNKIIVRKLFVGEYKKYYIDSFKMETFDEKQQKNKNKNKKMEKNRLNLENEMIKNLKSDYSEELSIYNNSKLIVEEIVTKTFETLNQKIKTEEKKIKNLDEFKINNLNKHFLNLTEEEITLYKSLNVNFVKTTKQKVKKKDNILFLQHLYTLLSPTDSYEIKGKNIYFYKLNELRTMKINFNVESINNSILLILRQTLVFIELNNTISRFFKDEIQEKIKKNIMSFLGKLEIIKILYYREEIKDFLEDYGFLRNVLGEYGYKLEKLLFDFEN